MANSSFKELKEMKNVFVVSTFMDYLKLSYEDFYIHPTHMLLIDRT